MTTAALAEVTVADPAPPLLNVSDAAVGKVAEMLAEEGQPGLRLRIYVTGGGCSGFQYGFAFDDAVAEDDTVVERGGIGIAVDAMSLQYLSGAEIDYEDDLQGARFVIRNPNATTTCGCGSSFSV
ncbi:MAG: iron-sulfur cluster insertion protein ErpA [Burkholderiales bacterium]|nr:iron-sulfur cluster insertion protein ErpA [Burkholderiales bacterium]